MRNLQLPTKTDVGLAILFACEVVRNAAIAWSADDPILTMYWAHYLLMLVLALTRHRPAMLDRRVSTATLCAVSYAYPYLLGRLFGPGGWSLPVPGLALGLMWCGLLLSIASVLCLGRSFGIRPALRGLAERGPYAVVRHPLYASYLLADMGLLAAGASLWLVLGTAIGWMTLWVRIQREEAVLSTSAAWLAYARRVRFRVVPRVL